MEKEIQPDSMTTVTIKPEYPPSEVYSSEPPPAYTRTQSSVVQVAKIIAVTMVLMSFILGSFLLASAYVTATASCKQMEQEMEMFNDVVDRLQIPSSPEALVQAESLPLTSNNNVPQENSLKHNDTKTVNTKVNTNESNRSDNLKVTTDDSSEEKIPILIKVPLQLDFDDIAGALLDKNQKSRMNCVVEKKRAEETIDHQPKTLNLPFGINVTTNPRFEHITGERMAIFCESGNIQKQTPSSDDDQDNESIMIQPVMIPFPQAPSVRHMTVQEQVPVIDAVRAPVPLQEDQNQLPPNQILQHIAEQIIAHNIIDAQKAFREQKQNIQSSSQREQQYSVQEQNIPIPTEILSQLDRLPNQNVFVAVSQQDYEESPEDLQRIAPNDQEFSAIPQNVRNVPQQMNLVVPEIRPMPQRIPNMPGRLPENPFSRRFRPFPNEAENTAEVTGELKQQEPNTQHSYDKESYVRLLPVHVPAEINRQEQEARPITPEETRPHYVHPRSVRSVDSVLPKSYKRVKRCSCDCAC